MRKNAALSVEEKMDAREALNLLAGSGISLTVAAQMATGKSSGAVRTSLQAAIDLFQRDNIRRQLRPSTIQFYEDRLRLFSDDWGDATALDSIARPKLRAWLLALPGSDGTRKASLRAVSRLFAFALEQEPPLCQLDPTEHLKLGTVKSERAIDVLTVDEAAAIMAAAEIDGLYAPALAIMLFAGVRPMELRSRGKPALCWQHVDFANREIRIPAEISKTRQPRILEKLPDNLWRWLEPAKGKADEPICPGMVRQAQRIAKGAIDRDWVKDFPRHSFATYHIAAFNDITRTSMILGHEGSTRMIHRHYRGLASAADAKRYFEIVP